VLSVGRARPAAGLVQVPRLPITGGEGTPFPRTGSRLLTAEDFSDQ
jgi:hypothetical protein